jgi:hypothetical protein
MGNWGTAEAVRRLTSASRPGRRLVLRLRRSRVVLLLRRR